MAELGIDIESDPVIAHPLPHAHSNGCDLFLVPVSSLYPDTDTTIAAFAAHAEPGEGSDYPFFELVDVTAHILSAPAQIEHDVGDALSRAVIGVAAAAAGAVHRQPARLEKIFVAGAGPGGVERRVLEQPDKLGSRAGTDRGHPPFHLLNCSLVLRRLPADPPLDCAGSRPYLVGHVA